MTMIVVKLVGNNLVDVAQAKGELSGTGFTVVYEDSADMIGLDAKKHSGGEKTYGAGYVIIGRK